MSYYHTQLNKFSLNALMFTLLTSICYGQKNEQLRLKLDSLHSVNQFSGIVHVQKGDDTLFTKSYGYRNFEDSIGIDKDTKFNIGSITKLFTAVATIKVLDKHNIDINSNISAFLPKPLKKIGLDTLTFHQLLTHTSSLGNYLEHPKYSDNFNSFLTVKDYLLPDLFTIDKKLTGSVSYSNTGVLLLGILLEEIEEKSFKRIIDVNIFIECNMKSSGFYHSNAVEANRAIGYFTDSKGVLKQNIFHHSIAGSPAGGAYSSINDLLRFYQCLRTNKLVTKEQKNKLLKPIYKNPSSRRKSSFLGLLFGVDSKNGSYGHSGGSIGISCYSRYYPNRKLNIIVLQNYESSRTTVSIINDIIKPWL